MNEARAGYLCMTTLLTMWASPSAQAEEKAPPKSGLLVRVTAPTISQTPAAGTLVATNDRELTLVTFDARTVTLPRDAVTQVEWSAGRRSRSGAFARQGAIALGLAGGVAGAIVYSDDMGERVAGAAITAAAGALWGAAGGALIGAFKHSYEWREGLVPGLQASVSPSVSRSSAAAGSVCPRAGKCLSQFVGAGMTVVLRW